MVHGFVGVGDRVGQQKVVLRPLQHLEPDADGRFGLPEVAVGVCQRRLAVQDGFQLNVALPCRKKREHAHDTLARHIAVIVAHAHLG